MCIKNLNQPYTRWQTGVVACRKWGRREEGNLRKFVLWGMEDCET